MKDVDFHFSQTDSERIFHPRKLAIIGVSSKGTGFGSGIFYSLRAMGYAGRIFLVNPKGGSLEGETFYQRVADIPEEFDLAVISVAAGAVPAVLDACRRKGAAAAEILSSGFQELGTAEGIALEKELVQVAKKGIRVIGPNCFGIYCPQSGLTMMPGPDLSREPGPVAFSSQSGGMAVDFANLGKSIGLGFSKMVSFGNGADLRETELLRYFGRDPQTRIVALYIEGVEDGDAFFETLRWVARRKPVIVMKGGLSDAGSRAVASHTASMGGSGKLWPAILRQANAVQVRDMPEMARTCLAFAYLPAGSVRNISVLGGGGAMGVAAADAAEAFGLHIPPFDAELAGQIDALLPKPGSSPTNPIDLAKPYVVPEMIKEVLRLAATDPRIDLQILMTLFYHYKTIASRAGRPMQEVLPFRELADGVREVMDQTGKPVVLVLSNPKRGLEDLDVVETIETARRAFLERAVPVFDDLHEALQAVGHLNAYYGEKADE